MNNVYVIYGMDYKLIKREIDNIIDNTVDVIKYDLSQQKIDLLLDDALCMSIFGDKKVLIGENAIFLTSEETYVSHDLEYFDKYINDSHDNTVILTCLNEKLDERKKIVKKLKDTCKVIGIEKVNEKKLPDFVVNEFKKLGYKIDGKTSNYFVEYVGNNLDIIINEINKMVLYKNDDKIIHIDDINNISSKAFKDNIFELLDGIMKKNYKKMFDCYNDLKILGEDAVKIISMLSKQVLFFYKIKLYGEEGKSQSAIASELNVHPYRVKLALESDYMIYELEDLIKKLHNLDFKIKTGEIDKNNAFEEFLIKL